MGAIGLKQGSGSDTLYYWDSPTAPHPSPAISFPGPTTTPRTLAVPTWTWATMLQTPDILKTQVAIPDRRFTRSAREPRLPVTGSTSVKETAAPPATTAVPPAVPAGQQARHPVPVERTPTMATLAEAVFQTDRYPLMLPL